MTQSYDVVVIGAGPNGLTAAAVLAKHGRSVLVVEAANEVGGHTRAIEFAPGYRAPLDEDAGWAPSAVLRATGVTHEDLRLMTRPVWWSVARDDGSLWTLRAREDGARAVRELSAADAARWPAFVERLNRFAGVLEQLCQRPAPDIGTTSLTELASLARIGRRIRSLGRRDMAELLRVLPMSIQDLLDDTFESEPLRAGIAAHAVRDLRYGPRAGGTVFNLLHRHTGEVTKYLGARLRFHDGPDAFTRAVAKACGARGVTIRTSARVASIQVDGYAAQGIALESGETIAARAVLSTADPHRTLLQLVDPVWLDPEFVRRVKHIRMRGCTAFVLYALGELDAPEDVVGSRVSLTADCDSLERAADAVKYGTMAESPHVEFFAPTVRWPRLAPDGKHVIAARVHYAPYALSGGWDTAASDRVAEIATKAIARVIPRFESAIEHRAVLTPPQVEAEFGVTEGALTHGEMALDQILFMRPVPGWSRYRMPVDGLYLAGAGAHPGPGVSGAAGLLAARELLRGS